MSGGSFDYMYGRIKETYVGEMQDADLDEMMKDLCGVLHDLEWWQSGDYNEEDYRKSEKNLSENGCVVMIGKQTGESTEQKGT